jgi:acetate kinase
VPVSLPACCAAALGGLDAFVFTAGIGENSATMRCTHLPKSWPGSESRFDADANTARKPLISRKDSRVAIYVIPTNEELMIAQHTLELLSTTRGAESKLKRA